MQILMIVGRNNFFSFFLNVHWNINTHQVSAKISLTIKAMRICHSSLYMIGAFCSLFHGMHWANNANVLANMQIIKWNRRRNKKKRWRFIESTRNNHALDLVNHFICTFIDTKIGAWVIRFYLLFVVHCWSFSLSHIIWNCRRDF